MLSRRLERGSTSVAFALAAFLVCMTVVSVYFFWAKVWWFPPAINDLGHEIDAQFARTFLITGVVFVLAQLGLACAVFKFRDRGQKATYFEGNNTMEIIWTLATIVLFVGLGLYARNAWAEVHFMGAEPGALQIEVTGEQFVWNFRYAGPDGKFGREKPELVSASTGNPVGLDPTDPASKDERLKQDAVPGMEIHMHFTATEPGDYEIVCAQLCGLGHYRMHSILSVMTETDFQKWMKDQEAANQ